MFVISDYLVMWGKVLKFFRWSFSFGLANKIRIIGFNKEEEYLILEC